MVANAFPVEPDPAPQQNAYDPIVQAELLLRPFHGLLFAEIRDYLGTTDQNMMRRHPGGKGRITPALTNLTLVGLVCSVPVLRTSRNRIIGRDGLLWDGETVTEPLQMYYPGMFAPNFLHDRDGTTMNTLRNRRDEAMNQDHREKNPHRIHTVQSDDVFSVLHIDGQFMRSGQRHEVNQRGLPQLKPDAVMTSRVREGPVVVQFIDSRKSPEAREAAQHLILPHIEAARVDEYPPVLLICRNRFLAEHARLAAMDLAEQHRAALQVMAEERGHYEIGPPIAGHPDWFRYITSVVDFFVEYERSARTPRRIMRKLGLYFNAAKRGYDFYGRKLRVAFITETAQAERTVVEKSEALTRETGTELMVITTTYGRIMERLAFGDRDVWLHRGSPIHIEGDP